MPELKRTMQGGKMNRDLDERLIPNGDYREALNVNVGRSQSGDIGAVENLLGNVAIGQIALPGSTCIGAFRDNGNERIYFFVTNNDDPAEQNVGDHVVLEYDQNTGALNTLAAGGSLNFHKNFTITGVNFVDGLLFWTDDRNEPRKINVSRARSNPDFYDSDDLAAVAKYAPFTAPEVVNVSETGNESNFMEDKFIRFAYRFKFNDGEFSTISPFTPIVFGSIEDLAEAGLSLTDIGEAGEISAFVNQIRQVFLRVQVPRNFGITNVELLYNESISSNIYILEDIEVGTDGGEGFTAVDFTYDSQDPFRTLPGNQLTRVYDAVPRLAKAQEFAGGRIVYGNYLQNYNLPSLSFTVSVANKAGGGIFENFSVKSRRTYQVGVVLADRYGRQSPVILSSTGGDTVFVEAQDGDDVAQQLQIRFNTDLPDWAYSIRIVVKQREQEYYNWFWGSNNSTSYLIQGNNINKVPRDTTGETELIGAQARVPTTVSIYRKVEGPVQNTGSELDKLVELIYDVTNSDVLGATPFSLTAGLPFGTFETEPVSSELDIFFETSTGGLVSEIVQNTDIRIEFWNCWILFVGDGLHVELNRLRAGFNEKWFTVGLKAYVVQENFAEERRFNTLIHSSGLFNSRVGINFVNQFNESEGGITVSLDPSDGSVQKLYAEDTQMIIFQEDKISRSPIDKDFIYSAEGGQVPVTSNTQYLGTIAPYAGEYGISQDPESFAVYGTRKYFSDKNRGVVLRLSQDGLTEISGAGLTDFFRDALRDSTRIIGAFDEYHDLYNVTIVGTDAYTAFEDTNIATAADGYFTVSFDEDVRGWVSFKSFQQEFGTTLNNRYYTFNGGNLWEHNALSAQYNSFYNNVSESYVEVIFNDNPSVVKEFKTLGYEGTDGWICDHLQTDIEAFEIDPDAGDTQDSVLLTLNVSASVQDGEILGTQSQVVLTSQEEVTWIVKIIPTSPQFVFNDADLVTAEFNSENITGIVANGNIYFILTTEVPPQDTAYNLTLTGGASQDITGAILTINLINNLTGDDLEIFIPADFEPRAGVATLAYNTGDSGIEFGVRQVGNLDTRELPSLDVITNTLSDSLTPVVTELDGTLDSVNLISFDGVIVLPGSTTTGTITITGGTVARPIITFSIEGDLPNLADDNYAIYYFDDDGALVPFPEDGVELVSNAGVSPGLELYVIGDVQLNDPMDDDDFDTGFYWGSVNDLDVDYSENLVDQGAIIPAFVNELLPIAATDVPDDLEGNTTDATLSRALRVGVNSGALVSGSTNTLEFDIAPVTDRPFEIGRMATEWIEQDGDAGNGNGEAVGGGFIEISLSDDTRARVRAVDGNYNYKYYMLDDGTDTVNNDVNLRPVGGDAASELEQFDPTGNVLDITDGFIIDSGDYFDIVPNAGISSGDNIRIYFAQIPNAAIPPGVNAVLPDRTLLLSFIA